MNDLPPVFFVNIPTELRHNTNRPLFDATVPGEIFVKITVKNVLTWLHSHISIRLLGLPLLKNIISAPLLGSWALNDIFISAISRPEFLFKDVIFISCFLKLLSLFSVLFWSWKVCRGFFRHGAPSVCWVNSPSWTITLCVLSVWFLCWLACCSFTSPRVN